MGSRNALLGALYTILQPLLLSAVGLPATAYVIRSLGSTGYGQWAASTSLVGAVAVLTSFGMRPLFVRRVAQAQAPDDVGEELAHQLGLRSLLGLGAGALIVSLCLLLRYPTAVILCTAIAAFGLLMSALSGVLADVLQGHQRLRP